MINLLKNDCGRLRSGWWILAFYLTLGALVAPATILASARGVAVSAASQAVLAALATGLCLLLRRERPSSVLGSLRSWRLGVPIGLALGIAIWAVTAAVVWASGSVDWQWIGMSRLSLGHAAAACLAVAAVEELVFRGFAFQRLVEGIGAWPAQILMAAYFVLTHSAGITTAGQVKALAVTNIFIASLLFGATYLSTRSLAIPIALHFALNFVQGPVLGFGISGTGSQGVLRPHLADGAAWWTGGPFGLEASIPGTVMVALALLAVLAWLPRAGLFGGPTAGAAPVPSDGAPVPMPPAHSSFDAARAKPTPDSGDPP